VATSKQIIIMTSAEIRQAFIEFFKAKDHVVVPASPVVAKNDPTLLFTNAGMNQFKPVFLGKQPAPHTRVVNVQPCIRVSGKHNDLEDVGLDTYHHTSFEMLGNWSFGDYYKKEAIQWAWELFTEVFKFNKQHLVVTVFEDDEESEALWLECTDIAPNHVVRCGKKDNFWEMGATGPCGPCSEIHLDLAPGEPGIPMALGGGLSDRYMELWNLVFIQSNRLDSGHLEPLPERHVDTGAGLERLAAQLQGVGSNYDSDCFTPIVQSIESSLRLPCSDGEGGTPHRVVADHIRTVVFGIADNVIPSNEGQGYVLRRLIRRALRFASQAGKKQPFLHTLVPLVHESLGGYYAHIGDRLPMISELIKAEEEQFLRTVESGLRLFHQVTADMSRSNATTIGGDVAFKLYDTFGFPIDLTQVMAKEHGLTVDELGFEVALNAQRDRSRQARLHASASDDAIDVVGDFIGPVLTGVYEDAPGGGEARIPANDAQRFAIAQHHTATHLLHEGLRRVVGEHVQQAGSMVDINRLRFDFSASAAVSDDALANVTDFVNQCISDGLSVHVFEEALDAAKAMGAHAMFGEKYDDTVRVVDISTVSLELCGGNHVTNTKDLQVFRIVSESSVAAGIRRIEALVGNDRVALHDETARQQAFNAYLKRWQSLSASIGSTSQVALPKKCNEGASIDELSKEMAALIHVGKQVELESKHNANHAANAVLSELTNEPVPLRVGGVGVFKALHNMPVNVLRECADRVVQALGDSAVVLVSSVDNKAHAIAKVSASMVGKVSAKALINDVTQITGGGGGGKDALAQAGGLNAIKLDDALDFLIQTHASVGD
jgi:alanyl-tRNA synthetase